MIVGFTFLMIWLLGDRGFKWTSVGTALLFPFVILSYLIKDYKMLVVYSMLFILFLHLYLYDLIFIKYFVMRRNRR